MKEPCNYEMLSNFKYQQMFCYTPIEIRDTAEEIKTSDQLERLLNLGFMPEPLDLSWLKEKVNLNTKSVVKRQTTSKLDKDKVNENTAKLIDETESNEMD